MPMTEHMLHTESLSSPSEYRRSRLRLRMVQIGLLALFAVIAIRLADVQVVEYQKYRAVAQKQYQAKIILPAPRGLLCDRNGNCIASNTISVSFAADPQSIGDDTRAIAETFSAVWKKPTRFYLDKLQSDSRFVWLERCVDANLSERILSKKFDGLVSRDEPKRLYFHEHLAGQLIGTTDVDDKGVAGLELAFDEALRGEDGYVILQRDGLGHEHASVDYPRREPVSGHSIEVTLDMGIQAIAEKELQRGIDANKADGGIVVILRPATGEILAIAQSPGVDPNNFGKFNLQDQKLRAVTDVFEPGSVFKIVTASAALENHLVAPTKKFYAENGKYVVPGRPAPIEDTHKDGWITFQEGMEHSSNIVMAKVSDVIGSELFYKMARDYGFGITTNIDFPGEVKGVLKKPSDSDWHGTTLNSMAFGYEVGVTPIQLASAYAAVANDGILMQPYLFRREYDATGKVYRESKPQQIRRVISSETAHTMRDFFVGVVERGTGRPAAIPGMKIAGKTGTSRKYLDGKYVPGNYTASFVGFLPADNPQIVCLVMMDNPKTGMYTGGLVSAPVFRAIVQQILNTSDLFASPPQVIAANMTTRAASSQTIQSADQQSVRSIVVQDKVPDVKGLSVRRAISILAGGKLEPVVNGKGTVVSQQPPAGQPARAGMKVYLTCQPRSSASLLY
ncbi:MAG TPA: penicillin-binding transpeptidase domain-containing protein [Bacteroidota bacterium]|nr:penicillin-binding transpeptidase domain-containing protein [Bacteroidota bacterium]